MAEGARLESVFRGNSNVGSNPTLSAIQSAAQRIILCSGRESRATGRFSPFHETKLASEQQSNGMFPRAFLR